jgi:hypothetical protein
MGTWYEVAKYPNWFQRRCIANTSATYAMQANGMLQVVNRCQKEDGSITDALGAAKQVGDATSPKLEVRFAPAWLSFLPFVWGNYWVIDLDPQYQLAAVRPAIMFFCIQDEEKMFFLWESFWALFPDLVDKNCGTNLFHQYDNWIYSLDSGQTNLSEELSLLLFELRWQ